MILVENFSFYIFVNEQLDMLVQLICIIDFISGYLVYVFGVNDRYQTLSAFGYYLLIFIIFLKVLPDEILDGFKTNEFLIFVKAQLEEGRYLAV